MCAQEKVGENESYGESESDGSSVSSNLTRDSHTSQATVEWKEVKKLSLSERMRMADEFLAKQDVEDEEKWTPQTNDDSRWTPRTSQSFDTPRDGWTPRTSVSYDTPREGTDNEEEHVAFE